MSTDPVLYNLLVFIGTKTQFSFYLSSKRVRDHSAKKYNNLKL